MSKVTDAPVTGANVVRVALLCEYLLAECETRLLCVSERRRRMDIDQGWFVLERWLVRLTPAARERMLAQFTLPADRERLFGLEPYALLSRRVDLYPDGAQRPWAWAIIDFDEAWRVVFTSDSTTLASVSRHPWHATLLRVVAELQTLTARFKVVEHALKADTPLEEANAKLEAELKRRKLLRAWRADTLDPATREAIRAPLRAEYHAQLDALKAEKAQLEAAITALRTDPGLDPWEATLEEAHATR